MSQNYSPPSMRNVRRANTVGRRDVRPSSSASSSHAVPSGSVGTQNYEKLMNNSASFSVLRERPLCALVARVSPTQHEALLLHSANGVREPEPERVRGCADCRQLPDVRGSVVAGRRGRIRLSQRSSFCFPPHCKVLLHLCTPLPNCN